MFSQKDPEGVRHILCTWKILQVKCYFHLLFKASRLLQVYFPVFMSTSEHSSNITMMGRLEQLPWMAILWGAEWKSICCPPVPSSPVMSCCSRLFCYAFGYAAKLACKDLQVFQKMGSRNWRRKAQIIMRPFSKEAVKEEHASLLRSLEENWLHRFALYFQVHPLDRGSAICSSCK